MYNFLTSIIKLSNLVHRQPQPETRYSKFYNLCKLMLYLERKWVQPEGRYCIVDLTSPLFVANNIDQKNFPKYAQESFEYNILFLTVLYFRWAGRDSNSHTLRRQILSLLRLPIPPPALGVNFTIIPYFFPKQQLFIISTACPPVNFSGTQYWYGMG